MCALPAPRHASIIKERNKVTKERNKVSTASAYYLEQRPARLIVECRGGRYQVFSVRYGTEYFTFNTIDTILYSIPILNKSEASIQDKHVDNIHIQTDKLATPRFWFKNKNMFNGEEDLVITAVTTRWHH